MTELPASWVQASLGSLGVEAQAGFPSGRHNAEGRGIPHLRPMNIDRLGRIDLGAVKYVQPERDLRLVSGDVLFNNTNSPALIGKTAYFDKSGDYAFSNHMTRLRSPSGLDAKFVATQLHFLWMRGVFRELCSHHVNQASVSAKKLVEAVHIVIPPLNEQRRIMATIDEQFSRLEAAELGLRHAQGRVDILRSSVITSLVEGDWRRARWKEVGRSQNGRAFPSRDYAKDGVKLLRPGNLHASGRVVWDEENTRRLPLHYEEEFPSYVVGPRELVMNLTAQSLKDEFLGRICLTGPDEHCLLNQRLARLTPSELDASYLLYVFKARPFRRFVDSLNKGSLIQHMFTAQLDDFEVPIPPLDVQRQIVEGIERQISIIEDLVTKLEMGLLRVATLRHSILNRAFRGTLVGQDPADEPASVLLERIAADRAATATPPRGKTTARA